MISLTVEPTPGCYIYTNYAVVVFFPLPTLVQTPAVTWPVTSSAAVLQGGLNVWSQFECGNHECFLRRLLILAVLHLSRFFLLSFFFFKWMCYWWKCKLLERTRFILPPHPLLHHLPSAFVWPTCFWPLTYLCTAHFFFERENYNFCVCVASRKHRMFEMWIVKTVLSCFTGCKSIWPFKTNWALINNGIFNQQFDLVAQMIWMPKCWWHFLFFTKYVCVSWAIVISEVMILSLTRERRITPKNLSPWLRPCAPQSLLTENLCHRPTICMIRRLLS